MSGKIFTIGHSTHAAEELVALLREHAVARLVDVRTVPRSRRSPQFARVEIARWLPGEGIAYEHAPALGGFRRPAPDSPNDGWRNAAFRGYADHMRGDEFGAALAHLEATAAAKPTAIMCAESVWWRCHRRLISDALAARGWEIGHIGTDGRLTAHELTPFAVVGEDGALTYPADPAQGSLNVE